jgi:hypothetical protein
VYSKQSCFFSLSVLIIPEPFHLVIFLNKGNNTPEFLASKLAWWIYSVSQERIKAVLEEALLELYRRWQEQPYRSVALRGNTFSVVD